MLVGGLINEMLESHARPRPSASSGNHSSNRNTDKKANQALQRRPDITFIMKSSPENEPRAFTYHQIPAVLAILYKKK